MSRRVLHACAALCLTMVSVPASGQDASSPTMAELEGRLSQEQMADIASGPMTIVQTQGLAEGKAAFERLLSRARARHGARSVETADLIQSFGVGLYTLGMNSGGQFREESIPYLEAAIPAYRAAFGPTHPEVAIALNSLADAQLLLNEQDPPQSVDAAFEEAYRIRLGAFGATHVLTLATLRDLAKVQGLPSRTRGERARIDAAAALFRQLVAHSPNDRRFADESGPYARGAFARMYAQNQMPNEAREQLRLAIEQAASWGAMEQCFFAEAETARLEGALAGENERAPASIYGAGAAERCFLLHNESVAREPRR